jgi:hypothetical protein
VDQSLSADLELYQFYEDAHILFVDVKKKFDDLEKIYLGSSGLVEEVKWRLASIMRELCGEFAVVGRE